MFHVKCSLPNASRKINGIEFVSAVEGVISAAPVSEDHAEIFRGIAGYEVYPAQATDAETLVAAVAGNVETKTYTDGTTATGVAPLPDLSQDQQDAAALNAAADFKTPEGLRAEADLARDAGMPGYAAALDNATDTVAADAAAPAPDAAAPAATPADAPAVTIQRTTAPAKPKATAKK